MEDNMLVVSGENGVNYNIRVIDIFYVDEFPGQEYIAYTFNEEIDQKHIKVYISILKETETTFSLVGISDKNEWEIVEKSFNDSMKKFIDTNNENA